MVNYRYQLEWVEECPGMWSNIILGISEKVFLGDLTLKSINFG